MNYIQLDKIEGLVCGIEEVLSEIEDIELKKEYDSALSIMYHLIEQTYNTVEIPE